VDETRIRVVVGEGDSPRRGLLRFVLEGDGYDVVAEASTPAQLARMVADHQPEVVVLDDGIGATAPQVVREISPRTKIVLVWPGAVVPIGGDARVEPSQVLRQLGPTVAKVTAGIAGLTTIERPEWIEKVRKDPATLRERLERSGGLPKRPSVTELQRRGQRLHPTPPEEPAPEDQESGVAPVVPLGAAAAAAAVVGADEAAEATIELPDTPESGAPVLHLPPDQDDRGAAVVPIAVAGTAAAVAGPDSGATEFNRRLGAIALGGAAVIGAVVFALALGGSRVPTDIIVAEGPRATATTPPPIDEPGNEPGSEPGNEPGEGGTERPPGVTPGTDGTTAGGNTTDGETPPLDGGGQTPEAPDGGTEPPPDIPPDDGGTEPPPPAPAAPGRSVLSNPHGVPPGQTSDARSASSSVTGPSGNGARHWVDGLPGHAGEHGQGIDHGKGLDKRSHHHKM
jgi:hypothetical protein